VLKPIDGFCPVHCRATGGGTISSDDGQYSLLKPKTITCPNMLKYELENSGSVELQVCRRFAFYCNEKKEDFDKIM